MVRTQIQLTEEQAREVKQLAAERGVSVANVIRDAVDRELEEKGRAARWERARRAIGKYRSGLGDVAEEHDKYLAEDFGH
jgi:hypothetical protein